MKKELKTEITRQKILNIAMKEFGTHGYSGGTVNNICHEGIAKGLLYHNYKNKDDLYLACVKKCFCSLVEYLKERNLNGHFTEYIQTRMQYFSLHESEAHLFYECLLQPPHQLQAQITILRKDFDDLNQQLYKKLLGTVHLRKNVTEEEALQYFTVMQTMFNSYFSSPAYSGLPFEAAVNDHEKGLKKLLEFMLYGIAESGDQK